MEYPFCRAARPLYRIADRTVPEADEMKWRKGQSGNPKGRPRSDLAIADLARKEVEKRGIVATLGKIGAREGDYAKVDPTVQLNAIKTLLAYGYGPPRAEIDVGDGVVIQVVYAERNQITIAGTTRGAVADDSASQTVQCGLLRSPLGQDGIGDGSPDPSGTTG
jgi:hypothetical protein